MLLDWNSFLCSVPAHSLQSCPTLCNPMDCNPPGSSVYGILQARILGVSCHALLQGIFLIQGLKPHLLHCKQILYPLSHLGSPEEYWSGMPCPAPGDLPDPGIKPGSPALQTDSLASKPPGKPIRGTVCVKCTENLENLAY